MQNSCLFRGKRIDNGEWVYGKPFTFSKQKLILTGIEDFNDEYISIEEWRVVDHDTVAQCTGCTDDTGRLIFEGDIVRRNLKDGADFLKLQINTVVVFNEDKLTWMLYSADFSNRVFIKDFADYMELIGNRWDNPELLVV